MRLDLLRLILGLTAKFLWLGANVFILVVFVNGAHREMEAVVVLEAGIILLSFPISMIIFAAFFGLSYVILGGLDEPFGLARETSTILIFLTMWFLTVAGGYYQWFVLAPKLGGIVRKSFRQLRDEIKNEGSANPPEKKSS